MIIMNNVKYRLSYTPTVDQYILVNHKIIHNNTVQSVLNSSKNQLIWEIRSAAILAASLWDLLLAGTSGSIISLVSDTWGEVIWSVLVRPLGWVILSSGCISKVVLFSSNSLQLTSSGYKHCIGRLSMVDWKSLKWTQPSAPDISSSTFPRCHNPLGLSLLCINTTSPTCMISVLVILCCWWYRW